MPKIVDFKYIYTEDFNEESNVFERAPIAIHWNYRDENFILKNETYRIRGDVSRDKDYVAVVEGPYADEAKNNLAYITNCSKKILYDIKELFIKKNNISSYENLIFDGVQSKDNIFEFIVNLNGSDFRISFEIFSAEIGEIIESR